MWHMAVHKLHPTNLSADPGWIIGCGEAYQIFDATLLRECTQPKPAQAIIPHILGFLEALVYPEITGA
jgi:hypothetical protein